MNRSVRFSNPKTKSENIVGTCVECTQALSTILILRICGRNSTVTGYGGFSITHMSRGFFSIWSGTKET